MLDFLTKFDLFFSLISIYSSDGVGCHYRNVFLKLYNSFVAGTFILQMRIIIVDAYLTSSCFVNILAILAGFYSFVVDFVF